MPILCWRALAELEERVRLLQRSMPMPTMPTATLLEILRTQFAAILGSPAQVIEPLRAYADAGADELMVLWFRLDDIDGLAQLAESVLPHVQTV